MNAETVAALKESIGHWCRIAAGIEGSHGGADCALCLRFSSYSYDSRDSERCVNMDNGEICPVSAKTGESECQDSPYDDFISVADFRNGAYYAHNKRARAAAARMAEFLIELLSDGELGKAA